MSKTERFEMRLDSDLIGRVDEWRDAQEDRPSRAEAMRRLLEAGLSHFGSSEALQLDKPQRLIVWMLSELLKQQRNYREEPTLRLIERAIYGGHFWALDWDLQGVLHAHSDSPEAVKLVVDTMDMWIFVERAYARFSATEREKLKQLAPYRGENPTFPGFDGNNEGEHMHIAQFLVEEMGRFQDFKGRSMNSHSPKVRQYQQMVAVFEEIRLNLVGRDMTVDELARVLNADKVG